MGRLRLREITQSAKSHKEGHADKEKEPVCAPGGQGCCIRKTEAILGLSNRGTFIQGSDYTNKPTAEKSDRPWQNNPGLRDSGKLLSLLGHREEKVSLQGGHAGRARAAAGVPRGELNPARDAASVGTAL